MMTNSMQICVKSILIRMMLVKNIKSSYEKLSVDTAVLYAV